MQDLWYADFHENSSKAYQDLLKIILGTASEDSTDITEETVERNLISLRRDNETFLKFDGFFIGECSDILGWNYTIYKTADTVKTCDYIIHIDRRKTIVFVGKLYEILKFDSLESIKSDISKEIGDEECVIKILEILGIEKSAYLE